MARVSYSPFAARFSAADSLRRDVADNAPKQPDFRGVAKVTTIDRPLIFVLFLALTTSACSSPTTPERPPAATSTNPNLVAPPRDDTGDEIESWVDRQVVTDWSAEIVKRNGAIDAYLNDTDPVRAEKYGFRSGQNPQLAWSWFRDAPVGFNGLPFVLLKTILDLDPEHTDPSLRRIARIWKHMTTLPLGKEATAWTFDHLGMSPAPSDYRDGVAIPIAERQAPLPFGLAFENPRLFEPLSDAEMQRSDAQLRLRQTFQSTSLLLAKVRTVSYTEENWERDRPGFGNPGTLDRVSLSCAACHVGRVVVSGRIRFLPGMPNTEIEAQYFS